MFEDRTPQIRINTTIKGEPAQWLLTWKKRGLVLNNTDAVVQAFQLLQEKITERDVKLASLIVP